MRRILGILVASCAAVLICSPARATTTFSIQPVTVNANPDDVGDTFDVVLTNNGPDPISVAAFEFEVSVTDPDITLTGADFSPSVHPYIFAGDSFDEVNSLPLNTDSGQTLDGSDSTNDLMGITLTSGESLALGEVLFSVADPATPGPFTVSFTGSPAVSDSNNLTDPSFNPINVDDFSGGTIDISGVSTPEPSSFLLMLAGAATLAGWTLRRRLSSPIIRPEVVEIGL